tara:strand:- start:25026 stop:25586 length:561 start_codon:yes stop_codon:yes gene_type:complete
MESNIESSCPVCGNENSLKMIAHTTEIAYFGEHTQVTLLCSNCGLRQTDFIPAEDKTPGIWTLKISSSDDLDARVIRGSNCSVEIPELELAVFPGTHSSGYVSNVEGVINRFIEAIKISKNQFNEQENSEEYKKCDALLESLDLTKKRSFTSELTLIFSDPMGHSKILHKKATFTELTKEEAEKLL